MITFCNSLNSIDKSKKCHFSTNIPYPLAILKIKIKIL